MRDRTDAVTATGCADHVVVCTGDRESEYACCADAGGAAVLEAVRSWLRDRDVFWSRVYVAETGCLGLCSADGAAVAVHPRGRWFTEVTPADVSELMADVFGPDATDLGRGPSASSADAD